MRNLEGNDKNANIVSPRKKKEVQTSDDCYSLNSIASSFSLQDCIEEFQARKVKRALCQTKIQDAGENPHLEDDQNRSNKQNEKLYKPCKNGFCYCFTSDDSDCRRIHTKEDQMKSNRRSKKAGRDNQNVNPRSVKQLPKSQPNNVENNLFNSIQEGFAMKQRPLVAISKLKEMNERNSISNNGPLVKIIQEICDNCVISEVRVNQKLIDKLQKNFCCNLQNNEDIKYDGDFESPPPKNRSQFIFSAHDNSAIDSLSEAFISTTLNTSSRSTGGKSRSSSGGRLLKKRLSQTNKEIKPRNLAIPPKKPPRYISDIKSSSSSSTTASLREANRILDDFLRSKGIDIPGETSQNSKKRKSFPLDKSTQTNVKEKRNFSECPIPSCPSLSDIEKKAKRKSKSAEKTLIRNHEIGWVEPKILDMLYADNNTQNKDFQSNFPPVGPQESVTKKSNSKKTLNRPFGSEFGEVRAIPKQDIDTVDGDHNLAENMQSKSTPVKSELFNSNKKCADNPKSLKNHLTQIVNISPWSKKSDTIIIKPKSNLKSSSSFLTASRKKILKFVSNGNDSKNTRTVGVQTVAYSVPYSDFNQQSSRSHSYFSSPANTTKSSTPLKCKGSQTDFDFSRTIKSPPKKDKATQRKLNFPLISGKQEHLTKTYQSYHSDLDKDVSISKMGYILSGIRAKLEASDEFALCTFRDVERREHRTDAADCVDGRIYHALHASTTANVHTNNLEQYEDPIYSEIEEDSFVISGSPVLENATAIDHFSAESDPTAIYAKVRKKANKLKTTTSSQSYNDIQVMERNCLSTKKCNSETDIMLQKSFCFMQNTNRPELQAFDSSCEKLEKTQNVDLDVSYTSVSNESLDANKTLNIDHRIVDETSAIELPNGTDDNRFLNSSSSALNVEKLSNNQCNRQIKSYPIHLTQLLLDGNKHSITRAFSISSLQSKNFSNNSRCEESKSLNENAKMFSENLSSPKLLKVSIIKDKIRKSFYKSKKRFSTSFQGNQKINEQTPTEAFSSAVENVFSVDEEAPVEMQLAQAVKICRILPELEISNETAEAERLLLFSSLKSLASQRRFQMHGEKVSPARINIDEIRLPIKSIGTEEVLLKYFYICVFTFGNQIKSTQSVECVNDEAIFRDCDISFESSDESQEVNCDIFVLRLRVVSAAVKISNVVKENDLPTFSAEDISSRFRRIGGFAVRPIDFIPFNNDVQPSEKQLENSESLVYLSATKKLPITVTHTSGSTNLSNEICVHLSGRVFMSFPKFHYNGFLNVQDIELQYNWNRRWCVLDGLIFSIYKDNSTAFIDQVAIIAFNLKRCSQIALAPRDVCARKRSFGITLLPSNDLMHKQYEFFFSAENSIDLNNWLCVLNEVLNFIRKWM